MNGIITELVKQKGFYKLQVKKLMKEKGLSKKNLIANPGLVEQPKYKIGLLNHKILNLKDIETEMKETQNKITEYSKNLEPGTEKDLFIGVGIVILESQKN